MKKIVVGIGVALLLGVVVVYVTLVAATYGPEACTYELDLGELRRLAASVPGERATQIRVEMVTSARIPRALACPGTSWERASFRVYAYQLVFPDRTIVVDTAMNRAQAEEIDMTEGYDEAAWQRVVRGIAEASAVYVTHEHADHMGGAVVDDVAAAHVYLTAAQLDSTTSNQPEMSAAIRAAVQRTTYERYLAVAPGVVLIAAPGHTPGSQMVFITRADGTEVLLTGDTAWLVDSIEREQGPAKLAVMMMDGDRNAQACQLAAVHDLGARVPELAIMPGHDETRMKVLLERGVFVSGFDAAN